MDYNMNEPKFNVTDIEFDFDDDYANGFDLTFDDMADSVIGAKRI